MQGCGAFPVHLRRTRVRLTGPLGTLGPSRKEDGRCARQVPTSHADHPPGQLGQSPENIDILLGMATPLDSSQISVQRLADPFPSP